nr:PREDICTED: uncharacterized protein K02A2.6-like [Megachile rotundata]
MDIHVIEKNPNLSFGNIGKINRQLCIVLLEEFQDCVSSSMRDLGRTNTVSMEIKCLTDEPVAYRPYRLAEPQKVIVRSIIEDLLNNGIIRESDSPYASPITLVKKKTGDFRMCVDYRKLNAITIKDKHPLPLIDDQIDQLGGNRWFVGLDLALGYYQVPVAENSIAKTAFITPEGHYEFLRMPFGLTNAPAVFQRLMRKVLAPVKGTIPFEEGLSKLREVLEALRTHGLTLRLEKCSFFKETIEYLGREVSAQGVRPGQRKIEAVKGMPQPTNVKQWLEDQEFTFEIVYRPESRIAHVDALSQNPQPVVLEVFHIDITEAEWIVAAQLQDEQLLRIRTILERKDKSAETKHYFKEYVLKANKLYHRLSDDKMVWVVPKAARLQIFRLCHDDAGHLGTEKTLQRIQQNYWFAGMRWFVDKYVKACLSCAYYKHTAGKKQCKLNSIEKVPVPFHTVHIDHVGPFETSRRRNKYLLMLVDAFTKFTIVEPVKSQKTRQTEKVLMNFMYLFGVPTRIISDRGTSFTSRRFGLLCQTYGIKHVLNAVATPRANGQYERYNRTIVNALAASAAGQDARDWDVQVKKVQSTINTMYNKSIGTTPIKALIGCDVKTVAEGVILSAVREEMDWLDLHALKEEISKHISDDQKAQKERYDRIRKEARKYTVGELVLVQITSEPATGGSRKLLPKFKGPFRIRVVLLNDRYDVEDLREGSKRLRTIVAADKIKPWIAVQGDGCDE